MATITLTSFTFNTPPSVNQLVLVSWRRASDPDVSASYTNAPNATVDVNGNIISPSPYQITGLPQTSIVIKAENNCGGAGVQKTFINCEPITDLEGGVQGQCPAGYTLSQDGTFCYQEQTQPPTITQTNYCVVGVALDVWTDNGSRVYNPGHNTVLDWGTPGSQYTAITNVPQWQSTGNNPPVGPMNRSAVWIDSDCNGVVDPLTSGTQVTLAWAYNNTGPARTIYVGIAGDNQFEFRVNNNLIAQTANGGGGGFKIFHIVPVQIVNGTNYFNIIGTGDGSTGDGISMVVYDNSPAQLIAATNDSQLNILFNSKSLNGQHIDIATCPPGWNLDTSGGQGNYVCRRIITTNPT